MQEREPVIASDSGKIGKRLAQLLCGSPTAGPEKQEVILVLISGSASQ